jgi:hypothetical protein
MRTDQLDQNELNTMKEFLLLVSLNFFSGYQIPRLGMRRLVHWTSSPLIENCSVGSYLFCKNFAIFYEDVDDKLS